MPKGHTNNPNGRPPKYRQDAKANTDGMQNVLLNIANSGDPVSATRYRPAPMLDHKTLQNIFAGDGMAKRVVTVPVDDAMREWVDAEDELIAEYARIQCKKELVRALYWSRLFGGAVIVALINDGGEFDAPLNPNQIQRVVGLRCYDRMRVTWTSADLDKDVQSANYGRPAFYSIQPLEGTPYRVHHSRLWRFDGIETPDEIRQQNQGWGDSAISCVFESLVKYGLTANATAGIIRDFVQPVLGIKGLSEMLRQGEDELVASRAKIIDMTRSVANLVMLDADGETYEKKASSVAGLADLWDRFALDVSAKSGIPATKLMGRSPAGQNATGESDTRQWYDVVHAYRQDEITPFINWLNGLLDKQQEWKKADRPDSMGWAWPSLWQPTEREWAEIKHINAQADAIYIDKGAMNPEYIAHLRFGGNGYQPEIKLDYQKEIEWLAERIRAEGGE